MQSTIKSQAKGIPEIPMDPNMHPQTRRALMAIREELLNARRLRAPLGQPTNFTVTAEDRSNFLQFTRPTNADVLEILWNSTPDFNTAQVLGISSSNQYTDYIGQVGVKRFYWVRARNYQGGMSENPAGPQSGTTLAVGSVVNPPNPPPPGQQQHQNQGGGGQREYQ